MSRTFIKVVVGLFVAMTLGVAGCGGGGGGSETPSPIPPGNVSKSTVSGTASEGALITGKTVKLKDANGTSAVDGMTNTTTGIYTIDVTGLTAPFLVTVTGTNGTYVSLAQSAGTANINPITTTVVALAAGTTDMSALFTSLTPAQVSTINANYTAKSALVSTSLQAALPTGVKAEDYFTGTVTAGKGMDAAFDTYQIVVHPTVGITIKTKDASATTVLTIPAATVIANTTQALPRINVAPVANTGTVQNVYTGTVVTLDGSGSSDANGDLLTYSWAFTSKPIGSSATLSSATTVKPTFTADVAGTYVFNLVVNDGKVNSSTASSVYVIATSNIIKLKFNLAGILPTSTRISGLQLTLTLPVNVIPATLVGANNANGSVIQSGLFTPDIKGVGANYIATTNTMKLSILNDSWANVTQVGEVATITLKFVNGVVPTIADFIISGEQVVGWNSDTNSTVDLSLAGIKPVVASVTVQ